MQELLAISKYCHGKFGEFEISGAKYTDGSVTGWQISVQPTPHDPSSEYWISGIKVHQAMVDASPYSIAVGPITTLTKAESEAIFAAISEWEKGLSSKA